MSHPSWVCGLKHQERKSFQIGSHVTPFVGVWIETAANIQKMRMRYGHTLRGCVD